jgi:hypothetical protein
MSMRIVSERFWQVGTFVDPWTLSHFFFGVIAAGLLGKLGLGQFVICVIVIFLAVLWEGFELLVGFDETFANRCIDVLATLIGIWVMQLVGGNPKAGAIFLLGAITLYLLLTIWSFWTRYLR